MANLLAPGALVVCLPPERVYRVSKRGRGLFSPPPRGRALPDGTFGGRFDDPGSANGDVERFSVVYAASTREAALGESIAQFRPSLATIADIGSIDPRVAPGIAGGVVTNDWRQARRMGETEIDKALRFVDISAHRTLTHLRAAIASTASAFGIVDVDLGAVAGSQRAFTQACARYLYDVGLADERLWFAGIRYPSRLHAAWECWAVFADRLRHVTALPHTIAADDVDLLMAAAHLGLTVEGSVST